MSRHHQSAIGTAARALSKSKNVALRKFAKKIIDDQKKEIARKKVPANTEIVVYCAGPDCRQRRAAADKLRTYGRVKIHEGGLELRENAGTCRNESFVVGKRTHQGENRQNVLPLKKNRKKT